VAGGPGLFAGTAGFYSRYRPGYPAAVFDVISDEAGLDGSSEVLDLGCGPGTMTLPLADRAGAITAVDADHEMLDEGARLAVQSGHDNIRWVHLVAEDFDDQPATYRAVVIGSAFHWMSRDLVAAKAHRLLAPGGVLAVIGNPTPAHPGSPTPWSRGSDCHRAGPMDAQLGGVAKRRWAVASRAGDRRKPI
jgi:SAM-dependent methyltransferase